MSTATTAFPVAKTASAVPNDSNHCRCVTAAHPPYTHLPYCPCRRQRAVVVTVGHEQEYAEWPPMDLGEAGA